MVQPLLEPDLPVTVILACWPQTITVFLRRRMACVGCAMAPFETLADVAAIYDLDLDGFLAELEACITQSATDR